MEMQILGWAAAGLVFASFFMKSIVNLRAVGICSNICFLAYAGVGLSNGISSVLPILVLHAALLPVNFVRLRQCDG